MQQAKRAPVVCVLLNLYSLLFIIIVGCLLAVKGGYPGCVYIQCGCVVRGRYVSLCGFVVFTSWVWWTWGWYSCEVHHVG